MWKIFQKTDLKRELEATGFLQRAIAKQLNLEVRSIDSKLANTERMFQLTMDAVSRMEKKIQNLEEIIIRREVVAE